MGEDHRTGVIEYEFLAFRFGKVFRITIQGDGTVACDLHDHQRRVVPLVGADLIRGQEQQGRKDGCFVKQDTAREQLLIRELLGGFSDDIVQQAFVNDVANAHFFLQSF